MVARERGRPEMTSQFDSLWSILYRCCVDILRLALSGKRLLSIFILGVFGDFEPLNVVWQHCEPKKALPYGKPRRLNHHTQQSAEPSGL